MRANSKAASNRPTLSPAQFLRDARRPGVADLTLGQPDFPVAKEIRWAAASAIAAGHNGYSEPGGIEPLRRELKAQVEAELCREVGDVIVTAGVSGGLRISLRALLHGGEDVLIPDPYFAPYVPLVEHVGARPVLVDTYPDFRLSPERLRAALTPRTVAIVLNSPANPTGVVLSAADVAEIVGVAREHDLWIISDEIYAAFAYDRPHLSPAALYDKTIILRGFSKSHAMTGWRVGFAAGPAALIRDMVEIQLMTDMCPPTPFQHAALVAAQISPAGWARAYAERRRMAVDLLAGHFPMLTPQGAFYAFFRAPGGDGEAFVLRALDYGVALLPGSWFSRSRSHVRLSFCVPDEAFERGCRRLLDIGDPLPSRSTNGIGSPTEIEP